jgi:hypothetical protein
MGQEPTPMTGPTPTTPARPPAPATDDPAAIRRDIDRTRGDMEDTIDAINDRVNPRRIRDRRTNRMRRAWYSARDSIMGSGGENRMPDMGRQAGEVREAAGARADQARQALSDAPQDVQRQTRGNPLTAGMIAFGIGTLIGSALPESDAERQAARGATDRVDVEGAKQRLTEHAQEVRAGVQDKAREAAQDLKDSSRDAAQDVKDRAQDEGQRVRGDAEQARRRA